MAKDKDGRDVYLAETPWMLDTARQDFPDIEFHFKSDFQGDTYLISRKNRKVSCKER